MSRSTKSTQTRLKAYSDLRRELEMQSVRLVQMREQMGELRSPALGIMPPTFSDGDKVSRDIIRISELEQTVESLFASERAEHDELERIIKRMHNADQRFLIRSRYFDGMDWEQIAEMMYGDRADYTLNRRDYVVKLYHLHTKSIISMTAARCRKT